jgi:hypothetical protein
VQCEEPPYQYVTTEGTVIQIDQPPAAEQMLAIARRYLPNDQAQGSVAATLAHPGTAPVHLTIRPDRWLTADFSDDAE